ncbi:MAG: preprotein translocase subunit SecG [Candidatus Omnitrophota bacterium]|jgi:preprotein translocase subunit SecG
MYNVVLIFHILIALALIGLILIQRGRSGGLVEALGGVESIFGTKTNAFFVKTTVVLAILFFVTSVSLAYISKQQGKSLLEIYPDITDKNNSAGSNVVPADKEKPEESQTSGQKGE